MVKFSVVIVFFLVILVVQCRRGRGKRIPDAFFDSGFVYTVTINIKNAEGMKGRLYRC